MDEVLTSADVELSNASVAHGSAPPMSSNLPLVSAVLAFSVAQFLKLFTTWYKDKRWDSRRLLGSGGMPSSHSATVAALAVAVGLQEGIGSTTFALAVILASIDHGWVAGSSLANEIGWKSPSQGREFGFSIARAK